MSFDSIGESTAEALALEGDGFLLQHIFMERNELDRAAREKNQAEQRIERIWLRLAKVEQALRLKHKDGANLIYAGSLVRVHPQREGLPRIDYESFKKVP